MTDKTGIDWEDAFANALHIPNGNDYPARWTTAAHAFRATAMGQIDLAYGESPRERLDLFLPPQTPRGLIVFIHGGFWLAFDKSSWSHLAAGPLSLGWAVAMPSYTLAPKARITEITCQIARAISYAANLVDGPIRLSGHSAGGHLATRMICDDSPLSDGTLKRIDKTLSISGVHDLRPLQLHSMNASLQLDTQEARTQSPALRSVLPDIDVTAWVGAAERPEFLRQSALLAEAWSIPLITDPARHHFDVIEGLIDPEHPLTRHLAQD